jgi:NADPH2:quinone reductase
VTRGETILFHAAAGGLGQIFCQWAKSLGCTVIGTVGSDAKAPLAKKNGCDHVINYTKENFAQKVLEITSGVGVPVVYDGVGKSTLEGSLKSLKVRGTMVSFGNASGPLAEISIPKSIQPKGLFITRPTMHHYLSERGELEAGAKVLFEKIESGQVEIEIFKRYTLDEVVKAHTDLENRRISGPSIIIPS